MALINVNLKKKKKCDFAISNKRRRGVRARAFYSYVKYSTVRRSIVGVPGMYCLYHTLQYSLVHRLKKKTRDERIRSG